MQQRSTWRQVALVAAIVGAGISTYLLVEYLNGSGGICLTGSGCDEVRLSQFAYPLGIPMPLFGLVFYLVASWTAWRSVNPQPVLGLGPRAALLVLGIAGVVASAILTGLEAFVIHSFCTWCLAQAVASLVLFVAAVGVWRGGAAAPPSRAEASRRAQRRAVREIDAERSSLARSAMVTAGGMAILVVGLLAGGALGQATPRAASSAGAPLAPASAPREGNGPVTVVEFSDFECPACASVSPMLQQLVDDGSITLVYRYFPLTEIHPNANLSARAAEAAKLQGQFWPMHDQLFSTQNAWASLSSSTATAYFTQIATQLGLDVEKWKTQLDSSAVRDAVQADRNAADALSLPGTPSLFINGTYYTGALSLDAISSAVTAARGSAPSPSG